MAILLHIQASVLGGGTFIFLIWKMGLKMTSIVQRRCEFIHVGLELPDLINLAIITIIIFCAGGV